VRLSGILSSRSITEPTDACTGRVDITRTCVTTKGRMMDDESRNRSEKDSNAKGAEAGCYDGS